VPISADATHLSTINEASRTSIDRNAKRYDAARPSSAEALVDEVIERSGIDRSGRILDIPRPG
jgi:hypothetical protein